MLTHNNMIKYQFNVPYFIIDNFKNIISYSLRSSNSIELLLRNTPQVGESIVELIPQDQAEYISKLIDYCLNGNTTTIADRNLVSQIVKSPNKVQILFISLPINVFNSYVVCLFVPSFNITSQALIPKHQDLEVNANMSQHLSHTNFTPSQSNEKFKINGLQNIVNNQLDARAKIINRLNKITNQQDHTFITSKISDKLAANYLLREVSVAKNDRKCGYCKSDAVERIPRSGFIKTIFFWIPIRRYICYNCLHKFHSIKKYGMAHHHHTRPVH